MYYKIAEILKDVKNEVEVFVEKSHDVDDWDRSAYLLPIVDKFIKRLEYNLNEIKNICEAEIKNESQIRKEMDEWADSEERKLFSKSKKGETK